MLHFCNTINKTTTRKGPGGRQEKTEFIKSGIILIQYFNEFLLGKLIESKMLNKILKNGNNLTGIYWKSSMKCESIEWRK